MNFYAFWSVDSNFDLVFAYALITAMTGTLVELFSPSALDDLTVPIATTMVIYFLALIT